MPDITEYLSVKEYAALMGKPASTVAASARRGRLPHVRLGWAILIHKDEPWPVRAIHKSKRTRYTINPVAEYLAAHYPCEALPYGALTQIGSIFGVTRERVRQIANANGFASYRSQATETRVRPGRMGRALCRDCGKPFGDGRFAENHVSVSRCPDCRWTMIDCAQCGKPVKVRTGEYLSHMSEQTAQNRAAKGQPQFTGMKFCNRECFGKWMGIHVGFVAHPENAGRVVSQAAHEAAAATRRMNTRRKVLDAIPGTFTEIIERSGVSRSAALRHLNRLVADDLIYYVTLPGKGSPREYHRKDTA